MADLGGGISQLVLLAIVPVLLLSSVVLLSGGAWLCLRFFLLYFLFRAPVRSVL